MTETRTAEAEQRSVRVGALLVHAGALVLAAVLVALALWAAAASAAVVAGVAGLWAMKLYGDLQAQAIQQRALTSAASRFTVPQPPADKFEG